MFVLIVLLGSMGVTVTLAQTDQATQTDQTNPTKPASSPVGSVEPGNGEAVETPNERNGREALDPQAIRSRLETIRTELADKMWLWLSLIPLLLVAILVVAAFVLIARWVTASERPFRFVSKNIFLRDLARQIVRGGIVALGILLALEILDATALVGAVLGAAGVVGLAIGFAFRDLVENYIASILLSLRQPFAPNDHVKIDGIEGKVTRLTSRATILLTFDGNHVRIPNATVFKGTIVNFTRKPERRFNFGVGVSTEVDLVAAGDLALTTLGSIDGVLEEPGPSVTIKELGDSSVTLSILGWVDQRESSFGKVKSEAIRLTKEAFDREGLEMPEPIQRIRWERAAKPVRRQMVPSPATPARNTAPDSYMDKDVLQERAKDEPDLLSSEAPQE